MGVASEGSEGGGIVGDCGVGTIVWVRRRNGSWWPGRILGQHELSASHLMSPRSGTPVKLLGREDASVDWYNLEKSKRVKAFRCGEFDACIERAEALQGVPIKKREKYARREDAILHALELEKQILEERHHKVGSISSIKDSGFLKEESDGTLPSGSDLRSGESLAPGKFINYEKFDLPFVEEPMGNLLYAENLKSCGLLKYEDSFSEATPPFMRGLQDFGLQTCTSKRKLAASGSYECSQKSFLMDNHAHALRGSIKDEEGWNNSSNSERFSPLKKKRFPSGFSEEGLGKRRDRRKPLLQVLQSSAKLPASQSSLSNCGNVQEERAEISVTCNSDKNLSILIPEGPNGSLYGAGYASDYMQISPSEFRHPVFLGEENASSGLVDPNECDISATFCLDPEMEDETLLRGTSQPFSPESRNSGRSVEDDCVTFHTPENNGNVQNGAGLFPSASECPHEQTEDTAVDVGVSRWNLKGKRNVRNLSRRTTDSADNKNRNGFISFANGGSYESKRSSLNSERERFVEQSFSSQADDFDSSSFTRKDRESELPLHGYNSYSLMLKGASGGLRDNNMVNSDDDSHGLSPSSKEAYALSRTQWDHLGPRFGQRSSERMESMLVDVTLKVQASSQGERVPLVSLMSKLNGKAIVGHPVQIEKLDDGSTNSLFPKHDSEVPSGYSGNAMPPPVWRTGRRTLMQRVPRPHPASSALEDSDTPVSDRESRLMFKRPYAVHLNGQAKLMKKSSLGQRPMHRKPKKKSSKKVSLSNQKTKRLSSIAMEPKHVSVSGRPASETNIRDVLVKPGNAVPVVACVPVKVLFSRILEAVGRTPSTTAACRSPSTDMADQEPS